MLAYYHQNRCQLHQSVLHVSFTPCIAIIGFGRLILQSVTSARATNKEGIELPEGLSSATMRIWSNTVSVLC